MAATEIPSHLGGMQKRSEKLTATYVGKMPKINWAKQSRSSSTPACSKPARVNKSVANEVADSIKPKTSQSNKKADYITKIPSPLRRDTPTPQKQQITSACRTGATKSAACPQLYSSLSPREKQEMIAVRLDTPEQLSTIFSKPEEKRSAFLSQDWISQLHLSACKEGPGLDKSCLPLRKNQRAWHRSLKAGRSVMGSRDQIYSRKKSKMNHKGNVTIRASPSDTMLVSPRRKPEMHPGKCTLHPNEGNETALANVANLEGNVRIANIPITKAQCSLPTHVRPDYEYPITKELEYSYIKNYSHTNSRAGLSQGGCYSQHLKKCNIGPNQLNNISVCPSTDEILQSRDDTDTQQQKVEPLHATRFSPRSPGSLKRCAETSSKVSLLCHCAFSDDENSVQVQETNEARSVSTRSLVSLAISHLKEGVKMKRPAAVALSENNKRLQKNIKPAGDLEVSFTRGDGNNSLGELPPHSQCRDISYQRPATHGVCQQMQRSNPPYLIKHISPSSCESRKKRFIEDLSRAVERRSSPPPQEKNVRNQAFSSLSQWSKLEDGLEDLRQSCINRTELGDSICSDEIIPQYLRESKPCLNEINYGVNGQKTSRKRLQPPTRSTNRLHRPRGQYASGNASDLALDKSPRIDWKRKASQISLKQVRPVGKNKKANSRDNYRTSLSVSAYKSDTDISNAASGDRKSIFLTVRPATCSSAAPYLTPSKANSPMLFEERPLGLFVNNKTGLACAESSGKASNVSGQFQEHLPTEDETGYEEKVISIKNWLETTSVSKFSIQGSERTSPDRNSPNLIGFKTECSSISIERKLYRENGQPSTPDISVNVTNKSAAVQDTRRSNLWPRIPFQSPIASSPAYFSLFKSAARSSLPPHKWPLADDSCCATRNDSNDIRFPPAMDEGSPKKVAALTAAGRKPCPRRMSKGQCFKQRSSFFRGRRLWSNCLLHLCVAVVAIELTAVAFLWHNNMLLSLLRMAEDDFNPAVKVSCPNSTPSHQSNEPMEIFQ